MLNLAGLAAQFERHMHLNGETLKGIAGSLICHGIKTPTGKDVWSAETVRHILSNVSISDLIQRKTFTPLTSAEGVKGVKAVRGVKLVK